MNTHEKKSVVQDWMLELSWKQQTVVLSALRGCDGVPKDDPSKIMSRHLRSFVLENAGTDKTGFMNVHTDFSKMLKDAQLFRKDIDKYPVHYVAHFMHACEILGYNYPDNETSAYWYIVYTMLAEAFHLIIEDKDKNDIRLSDGVDSD